MNTLTLLIANLYQQYLKELNKGHVIKYDWVEFYSHIVYLLKSGELADNEYTVLLQHSINHLRRMIESPFEYTTVYMTSGGLNNNDLVEGETKSISYWKLPLNANEIPIFSISNRSIVGLSGQNITGRSDGMATLTMSFNNDAINDSTNITVT